MTTSNSLRQRRTHRAKKPAAKPTADLNKKPEVMAMMKRAKGATLAEITEVMG